MTSRLPVLLLLIDGNPFINAVGCLMYADTAIQWLEQRLQAGVSVICHHRYSLSACWSFFVPRRMCDLTVPTGRLVKSAISSCVMPSW